MHINALRIIYDDYILKKKIIVCVLNRLLSKVLILFEYRENDLCLMKMVLQ